MCADTAGPKAPPYKKFCLVVLICCFSVNISSRNTCWAQLVQSDWLQGMEQGQSKPFWPQQCDCLLVVSRRWMGWRHHAAHSKTWRTRLKILKASRSVQRHTQGGAISWVMGCGINHMMMHSVRRKSRKCYGFKVNMPHHWTVKILQLRRMSITKGGVLKTPKHK